MVHAKSKMNFITHALAVIFKAFLDFKQLYRYTTVFDILWRWCFRGSYVFFGGISLIYHQILQYFWDFEIFLFLALNNFHRIPIFKIDDLKCPVENVKFRYWTKNQSPPPLLPHVIRSTPLLYRGRPYIF